MAASARTGQKTPLPTDILLLRAFLLRQLPINGRCLQNHYLATAVVQLLTLRSLPSNGSTCHNISDQCLLSGDAVREEQNFSCFSVRFFLFFPDSR
jgi:hypothetical protein